MSRPPPHNELTLRAILLGVLLSAILGAANAYLGLFAGMTVSASIPAAVLSMGLMKAFGGTILENNLVQTAASAGESAAAGAIFTLPALLLLGAWDSFPWLDCCLLIAIGGVLGVVFTTFLRQPLIVQGQLPFPEGVATAQVLIAGHAPRARTASGQADSGQLRALLMGGALGAVYKLFESGLGLFQASLGVAGRAFGGVFYLGSSSSPALFAVGCIIGPRIAILVCVGGLINWLGVIPWITEVAPGQEPVAAAFAAWSQKARYLGVGAMTFCGLYTLFDLRGTITQAITEGVGQLRSTMQGRVDPHRDLPLAWLLGGVAVCLGLLVWMFSAYLPSFWASACVACAVIVISFLFSTVAAQMAGMLGSSNNPVSGVTIATVIVIALLLRALGVDGTLGTMACIIVASVVCTAAAIGGDNVQDLKAGHILGASPVRQQILQLGGVLAAACTLGPVLSLLAQSYGFGEPSPEHPRALMAPQATLMASVAKGMFGGDLPTEFIVAGVGLGVLFCVVDGILKSRRARFRAPPLALALGLYLPLELSVPVLLGGLAVALPRLRIDKTTAHGDAQVVPNSLLLGAGLITGEALLGVVLAGVVFGLGSLDRVQVLSSSALLTGAFALLTLGLLARGARTRPQ